MVRETRHLWVGNLPDNIREDRIKEHFKRYGRVQNVKLLAKGAGGPEGGGIPGTPGGSGLCAAVAFMDIKSAAKAHGAEHTLDERPLTTVYYEPAAIPSSASAGSSPAGSGYSASSGSVNSASRYPNHGGGGGGGSEERCSRTGSGVSSGGSGGGAGGGAGGAGPGAYSSPAADRARPRDRLYRNGPTSYTNNNNNNNNSIIDRSSHRRWYGYASPSEGGGYTGAGSRRGRARSGSSSAASNSSSRSGSSSSAPRSPSSSSEGASSPEHRNKKHQWTSGGSNRPLAICVKNLPQRSSDSSLKDGLFHEYKKHGKVSCVKVVGVNQDRYAVVYFKKPSDVEKALEVSQDKLFFGCKISVAPYQGMDVEDNESRPYETDLDEFHPKATRTLFIGNLEKDVTPAMLREKFKHFGKIIEIDIKKQTGGAAGYAFCQYANISSVVDAIRSMDGEYVGNSRVKLGFGKSMATNCVWIDGVTENTEKQVISLCENIGSVLNVNVCKGTGHALVVFDQVAAAQQAVKDLRGLSVRGRKLQVDFASRECQDAFYEQLEKCSNSGIIATERFTDVSGRSFDTTNNRYNRYETQRRAPTTTNAYSARSARSSRYQNSSEQFEDFSDRRYRYEEFSGGSGSEAGTGGGYEGSVGPALQSVVVVSGSTSSSHAPHSNMRHLQKERVHLLEQLEECPSSGDELVSPKKKFKSDRVTLGRRPSGDTSRHHREISPCGKKRRGSETSKHHWRSPTPLSRSGTPLRDERPDSPPPTEPRRAIPVHRTKPMCLPLPRFAAQVLARVPPTSPMPIPDGPSAPASPLGSLATPRVPSPASSPGSSPSPTEPSLDERIRSLDERYEKWSGSRTASISECPEKSRFRPRLLDLDINEVQPSEVMRSVLAKRSVFDEDTKRLEGICDKFEPIRPICAFSSPSSARLSPSPLNSPQSAGRSPYAGSPVISTIKMPVIAAPSAPAKGLQYPFPSHPPSGLDGAPPIPPAPSEPTESDNKKMNDTSNIPRQTNASFSERVSGSVSGSAEAPAPVLNVFTSPNSTCAKPDYRTCKNSDLKSPLYKEPLSDSENVLKCDEKTISSYNSDSLDRRKIDYSDVRHTKTINTDVLADEIRDQSFKSNMCEKLTVDKVISDVKHQDGSMNLNKRSVVDSVKSESKNKFVCNNISDINIRRRPSKDESKDFDHKKEDNERRKRDDSRENRTFDKNIDMSITSNKMEKEENSHKEREDAEKEKERLENERLEKERLESERRERERLEQERREKQKLERERQEKERLEKERIEKLEKERLERERIERERIEKERIERERLEKERLDKEKMERERERIQKEKLEMERIHKEKQEREKLERERREREFLEKERIEKARREKERLQKLENERREKLEKERLLKQEERLEKERQEKIEKERQEKIEKERREKEISDKEKLDTHDSKLEKSERKKDKIDKESRRDKDYTSTNDLTHSSKEKRKDKEESIDSTKHRHKESYKKEQFDNRKDFKADISKTKEHSRKSSRDESVKELSRKDSSDSTASRHSHDSLKSKEYDVDLKDDSRYSSKSKHNSDNHKIRLHDKEVLPKSSNNLDTEVLLKSVSNDKSREIISPEVEKLPREKPTLDHDKHRHYSLDSQNEIKSSESKRKERLNSSCSLPANIGLKRRVSSQESVESTVDDTKKPKLSSESKKLIERRDSKDSSKHIDKNKYNMKSSKTTLMKHSDIKEEKHNIKEDDRMRYKESREKDMKDRETKDNPSVEVERKLDVISEIKLESPDIHAKNNSTFDILKSKDRRTSKEVDEIKSETLTSEDAESDHKAFFSRLELRSSEEDEKQRAQKEKMKEIKRIQQIKQIERLMQHQENKKLKNEERKKDMKDMKEKRLSNDRKSRDEKIDPKKPRKITNTSDTSDSDEPKKHSIFDIVDDGPTYISMYDKVKARSCKNMQKQEEEKRQEKIKAKFNQFKQCRAKREEKKRSTSWDEDSDSDREHKKSTSKSLIASSSEDEFRRRHKENITTDSENDHEKSKSIRRKLLQCVEDDSTDDNRKKPIARKKSHSRIVSDTSDDESFKKSLDIIKAFPDSSKIKSVKTLKKEKNVEIKMEPEDNIYESKHSVKNQEKLLNNYMDDKKLLESKHKVLTDIKNEPVFNVNIGETYSNLPQFDLKPKYNDLKSISYDDIKPTQLEDIKSIKYEDIKPTHCDISSEGEGIISDSMKLNSYLENRKKHKKKQKRQKSYPSDDEAKSDYHEKMQIINSICNSKNKEHIEKRKHSTKKEKKRDKVDNFDLFEKEKSLKKSKKLQDIADSTKSDIVNSSKREEKMQDIFGPFSDESDACNKDYPLIIDSQKSKNMDMFSPKTSDIESNHESHVSDVINKEKCREEIRRKKEKKRKERKSVHKDDENSLDIDAAGKAIEANLFDELFTNLRRSVETADHMPSNVSLMESDVFRFTDGDDSVESHMHPHHNMTEHSKKEGKEKKKKKKKNKENRQNRKDHHHYHHHHHDKVDLTIEKDTKSSDILFNSNSDLLGSPPMEVIDISQKTECKPPLPSPSLPILIDSPPPTKDDPPSAPSPTISNELNSSPTSKQVSKPGEIRRLSEKFIPGFGGEIDDTISESAVKSISDFKNSVIERNENILDSSHNSSIDISHKNEDKMEEKPRAIISQEETEDAVAALLGESFGSRNDGFSDCYSENTQSPAHAPIISAEVNDNIPEEEAEEMRQAVQSLNASELETKPDTPQSENDLQIDTDTDEGEDNSQSKSPEQGVISKAAVSVDEPKLSSQGDKGLKPQQLTLDSTNAAKRIELKQAPASTTVISKGWAHKSSEPSLLISTPIQSRDDKTVHISSILHLTTLPPQQLGQCRPSLSGTSKIPASIQVVGSIPRPPGSFSTQPPTIKIPADHVVYPRPAGIVISPRMSGDIRLHSPKSHGELPQKITNMAILTTGSPNLQSPPGLHSPSAIQQRPSGQITVVRMQQPPLSPIQAGHLPVSSQSRTMLSPTSANAILIQNPSSSVQLNRLPITPVLAPISKPIQSTSVTLQQPKTAIASCTSAIVHPPKLLTSEGRKTDIRNSHDIVIGSKLLITPPVLGSAQNATIMAQNRLMSASGNFPPQLPVLVGPGVINKSINSDRINLNGPINIHAKISQPISLGSCAVTSTTSVITSSLSTVVTCASTTKAQGQEDLNHSIKSYPPSTNISQNITTTADSKESKKVDNQTGETSNTLNLDSSKASQANANFQSVASSVSSNEKSEPTHTSIIVATKSEVNKNNQNDTITHNKSDTLKETTESHEKKDTKPPSTVEKSKCETDFEELLKQSACETKIENPHHTTVNKTTINESKVVINPSFSQHEVASVINDPTSNSKDSNDSKEDSDYWSAKEVNIDSVIKKVDALCSASELSDDSEHAKLEWSENKDIKSDISPKIKVDSNMKIEPNVKQEETLEGETHNEFLSSIEKIPPRIAAKRGGRGRGRKISEGVIERVQTRQGAKPNRGTTSSPRRGRGRIKVDKKSRSSSPGVHLPGDVYDFHEDSGDEMSDVAQNKNESRPRLILTIKSPLSSTVPNLQNAVTTNAQKEMPKTIQNVKDEKMEEFISPATNTRKSRRLQEKDVTRNTVDDVIEDVVKNTVPSKSVCGKESGPVRRSTRQNISTKPFNSDKNTDVRKSPRANKKQKDRRNSTTYESDEKSTKKDPLEITEPDTVLSVTEPAIKPDLAAPITPQVPVSNITNVITKPPKKMINEINAKLSSQILKSPESLQPSSAKSILSSNVDIKPQDVAEEHSNVIEGKPLTITNEQPHSQDKLEEKVKPEGLEEDMLDPVTGEMIRMTRGVDGMLIPISNPIPLGIDKLDSNIQVSEDLKLSKSITSNIPEAQSAENLNAPSAVKSTAKIQVSKPQMSSPTYSIVTTTPSTLSKSSSLDVGMAPSAPVVMTSVVTPSPILCTVTTTSNPSFPNITQGNIVTKSIPGNIIVPSSHIVSTINPMPMTTAAPKSSSVVSKPVMIKEMYGQYSEGIQQQHLIVKTSGGAIAGMKIGPGPLSPHAQPGLPPKEISQLHQMKPMPLQSQMIHPHKQPLVRPGCGVAGPGPLGPSLPRGAQGQHASPPLHKQHTAPQPIIAGASSTRVGLTAVPSISPQGQIPLPSGILGSPPPAHQQTSPVTPGEGMYPHFAHQHYPHYYRTHQDPRATPSPYVARSPLGAEGSEAPSPPLELRRPPGARVPHPAQSPSLSDRSTDSPQVSLYSSSSGSRYGEIDSGGRYYEAPSPSPVQGPPPPAHTPHRPSLHHRMLMEKAATTGGMGIDGGSAGDERGPSRGSAPAQGGTGLGRIQPGPPHASHAPREADSLMMLLRRYPVMWQGLLALKNDAAAVQMHFVHGNPAVASNTLPSNGDGSTPLLRIAQRMRLEPVQLEAVARKMQLENEHCMLLALPCGRDHLDVLQQSTHLTGGFITYLRRKLAAGIVNVAPPGHHQPLYTVHIFPSCEFANENLERIAPDLLHRVTDIAHLLIVIATV